MSLELLVRRKQEEKSGDNGVTVKVRRDIYTKHSRKVASAETYLVLVTSFFTERLKASKHE